MSVMAEPDMNLRSRATVPLAVLSFVLLLCQFMVTTALADETSADGLEDAERFARLLADTAWRPSATELEARYLAPGSPALTAFAATRVGDAEELGRALVNLEPDYRRALDHCLPAARALQPRVPALLDVVARALGPTSASPAPSVTFLFGAGRSAGTVLEDEVVIGLEVVCRYLDPDGDAVDLLAAFLFHEIVHVHQLRRQMPGAEDSLLRQAMIEGTADLVTQQLLGEPAPPARRRAVYGASHEAALWQRFRQDMAGKDLGSWMYGPGRPGEPADLGYWIGLRIAERYLETAEDQALALQALLDLHDPFELLERSGYAGGVPGEGGVLSP